MKSARILMLALATLLASCVSMSKQGPGEVTVRERLTVRLDSAWNKFNSPSAGRADIWTTDGLSLDSLYFYVGVQEGEALLQNPPRNSQVKELPVYHKGMQPHQVAELLDATLSADGSTFKLDRLAPAPFAGGEGFRFEFTWVRKGDEVELKGVAYGGLRADKLYMMVYRAPKIHYFNKHLQRVETLARTVQIKG